MKKMGGALQAFIWILFTVLVGFGSTIYYFQAVDSFAASDVIALLLWACVILLLFAMAVLLHRWIEGNPGILRLGDRAALMLEMILNVILVGGGIYLRIGREFVAFWSKQGQNPVVEAAYVTASGLTLSWSDPLSKAYVFLLNQLFMLVGNLSLAAAGMQLVIFSVCCFLLYFLVRRVWGAFCAVICLGGLMLFPEMIRASMYCSPEILLFLGAAVLGWVLHLCFDRFLEDGYKAVPDLLLLIWLPVGCLFYQKSQWQEAFATPLSDRVLATGSQTALLAGLLSLIFYLFIKEEKRAAAVYMLTAVMVLAVQILGMQADMGCRAVLCVVMSLLLGITLRGLLMGGSLQAEEQTPPQEDGEGGPPEIFIPKSMEIPARKKKAKIDYDRDFSESEMKFDIEIPEEEEFDR